MLPDAHVQVPQRYLDEQNVEAWQHISRYV